MVVADKTKLSTTVCTAIILQFSHDALPSARRRIPLRRLASAPSALHSAVVGEGACSLLLPDHLQAVSLSSSDPTPGIVRSRQRFAHRSRGRKKPQPLTAGASWQSGSNVGIRPFRSALKSARSLENSLFFPLLQGILEPRDQLAHDCHHHHAVRCEPMFPGLRQIARNLRAFPRVQMRDVRSLSPAEVAIASILAAGL